MDSINTSDYKKIYLETAREYLTKLFESINQLEKNPSDKDELNNLHISSHSLRSQSQIMNYAQIAQITSEIEKIARSHLDGGEKLEPQNIEFLRSSISKVDMLIKELEK